MSRALSLDLRRRCGLAACCFLISVAGCTSNPMRGVVTELVPFNESEQALWDEAGDASYRLRIGDTFQVDFKYQDELDQKDITILPDGRFTMAGLENVYAFGLTTAELDSLITAHFGEDYINPELSVIIQELGDYQVYVLGEVKAPGIQSMPMQGVSILQAIGLAGGFSADASPSETILMRVTPEGYLYKRCDLSHLEKRGTTEAALARVEAYDVIYVPRSTIADLTDFRAGILSPLLDVTSIFWDIYAMANLDEVERIAR